MGFIFWTVTEVGIKIIPDELEAWVKSKNWMIDFVSYKC